MLIIGIKVFLTYENNIREGESIVKHKYAISITKANAAARRRRRGVYLHTLRKPTTMPANLAFGSGLA
jgi:hypothetical protein